MANLTLNSVPRYFLQLDQDEVDYLLAVLKLVVSAETPIRDMDFGLIDELEKYAQEPDYKLTGEILYED